MAKLSTCMTRIAKDLAALQQNADLSLAAAYQDSDVRHVRALIIGPPGTPYEHGFFEFNVNFPVNYPLQPPKVVCMTTDRGRTRMNPNIYADGKVCLSTLGTWTGERGETWSCCHSLESILMSIQSLMSSNPYANEPGLEGTSGNDGMAIAYSRKVQHETIRISVLDRLELLLGMKVRETKARDNKKCSVIKTEAMDSSGHQAEADTTSTDGDWQPFNDLIKRRFLWYYDAYLETIADADSHQREGSHFPRIMFEGTGNQMAGSFKYTELARRMKDILAKIHEETDSWIAKGLVQATAGFSIAGGLFFQFTHAKERFQQPCAAGSRVELELPDKQNPFVWHMTIFGEIMTNLDGGIFEVQFVIPTDFPTVWPRARMTTPIHHRNVSTTGAICYLPERPDNLASHLDAMLAAIDDKDPKFDPRAVVNPRVSAQFWSEDERKAYTRQLRRSAEESTSL